MWKSMSETQQWVIALASVSVVSFFVLRTRDEKYSWARKVLYASWVMCIIGLILHTSTT